MELVNKIFWLGPAILIVAGGLFLFGAQRRTTPLPSPLPTEVAQEVADYQAGFAIFTNGTFRIFTDSKYHYRSEDVFIEPTNPNLVRVKKQGVTWDDFFKTLPAPMKVTKDCLTTGTEQTFCSGEAGTLKFYLNGKSESNLLDKEIQAGERALISFGNETEAQINLQFQKVPAP